jgi:ankyrin repeat domain-containing protein 17
VTPLLIAFRNGHIEVVEWLLGLVAHLPSEFDCQKALMAPKPSDKDIFPLRSKCYELIMKAKKAREQAALKNAQILFEELDAEKEKKETKRKAAARKKIRRKEKKKKEQAEKVPEVMAV